ncbi:hypothetical protein HMPREF1012_01011 [Bacillus sp. BT1B_CT2]|jgi:hypothetical protein|nr:SPBc2 prophage-derived uncharacterized protein YopT [Bacillus licheniformis]EFV72294.1 hypothetical protein HMPREF1012_01011 [Bacillus sp. BT1B_CT2]MCU9959264.1 SPBc2 prophage-derived uncharacterized protein YopT [Bacillus licheniformis]PZW85788.1 YopT-like protein [Bacillus sp. AG442]
MRMTTQKYLNNCSLQIDTIIENAASSTEYSRNKAELILEKLMEAYKVVFVKVDGETEEFEICNLEYEVENTEEDECGQPLALAMAK